MKVLLIFASIFSLSFGARDYCNTIKYPGFTKLGTFTGKNNIEKTYWVPTRFKAHWDHAKSLCHNYGMQFVSIESFEESNHLLQLCQYNSGLFDTFTHIGGLTSVGRSLTEWHWVESGEKLNFRLNFLPGQPDFAAAIEYCLSLWKVGHTFYYNDIPCYGHYQTTFICESKDNFDPEESK